MGVGPKIWGGMAPRLPCFVESSRRGHSGAVRVVKGLHLAAEHRPAKLDVETSRTEAIRQMSTPADPR